MTNVDAYESGTLNVLGNTTASSYTYYSPTDSTSNFPATFTNYYINYGDYNDGYYLTNGSTDYNFNYSDTFNIPDDYNSIDFLFIMPSGLKSVSSMLLNYRFEGDSSDRTTNLTLSYISNQSFPKTFNDYVIVDREQLSVPGPTGNVWVYKLSIYSEKYFTKMVLTAGYYGLNGYCLIPVYKFHYKAITYDEWEKQQMAMHQQTINEISQVGDEVSRLGDDVSRVGSEISRQTAMEESWHNEIMGSDYSLDDTPIDNMEDYVSQMDDIEASRDLEFSEGMDLINSFDESGFVDDVNSALVGLDDNIDDITVMSFATNLYRNLSLGDYVGIFVGFAVIFILFKFVIGGVV